MDYTSFLLQNPWRTGNLTEDKSVSRDLSPTILEDIAGEDATVITGGRQSGKTTLLTSIISHLLNKGISPGAIFYFNLDDFSLHPIFVRYTDFIDFIKSENKGFSYIFIDEIQRIKNPGLFLKLLLDLHLEMKLVVSGSSSLELKAKVSEHLTGRKHTFELFPFCFEEFLRARGTDFYFKKSMDELVKFHSGDLSKLLMEFVTYGGYPKVILSKGVDKKIIELKEIYDSYIKKDVADYLKVENIGGYNNLVKGLALSAGSLVNYNELSLLSGLSVITVKKYIDYLEGTYVFKKAPPYFSNARKEISKSPKIYAFDTGLMNYVTNRIKKHISDMESGSIMENFVFTELIKKGLEVKFWRTGAGAEVDFLVDGIPIEIKASTLNKPNLSRSFFSYFDSYRPATGFLVNANLYTEREINGRKVCFFPLWAVPRLIESFFTRPT